MAKINPVGLRRSPVATAIAVASSLSLQQTQAIRTAPPCGNYFVMQSDRAWT
ncbi:MULTISPECIES: hypothetical protein [Aerosakkonema]|uniref:hypothetical protein n=1 Tax=Aerosakkonema TaxID=1246629 RepID=UPI0035BB84BE